MQGHQVPSLPEGLAAEEMAPRALRRLGRLAGHVSIAPTSTAKPEPISQAGPPLRRDADDLVARQYFSRMEELGMPVQRGASSGGEYHTAAGHALEDILDWSKVTEQFDVETFMRDGVAVLKGIFTPKSVRPPAKRTQYFAFTIPFTVFSLDLPIESEPFQSMWLIA